MPVSIPALFEAPVSGAFHVVSWLATAVQPVVGPFDVVLAIVVFTAGVRLLLLPLSRAAVRGERTRAVLMPRLAELQQRYAKDPDRLRSEIAKLQAVTGSSPFTGCLPMLAQLPFFWVLYQVFSSATVAGTPNLLLSGSLLGTPIGTSWPLLAGGPAVVVLLVLLVVVAWFSSRWTARQPAAPGGRLVRLLPYGTVLTAAVVPLAAGVYLLTTTTWTVIERAVLRR